MVERHPDNVAAALLGGFVGSYLKELPPKDLEATQIPLSEVLPEIPEGAEREEWGMNPPIPPYGIGNWLKFDWANEVKAIVAIPDFEVPTAKAREVMPKNYNIKDVVRQSPSTYLYPVLIERIHRSSTFNASQCSRTLYRNPRPIPS
jgi:homoserine kinase